MKAFDKKVFLDKTFESSLDAIIFTDEKGYIVEVNQAYVGLTGYKKDEIIGKHTSEFSPMKEGTYECTTGELVQIDKKFSEQLRATMKAYVEKGKLQNVMGYQLRKDHKIVPVEDNMVFLAGDDGERIGGVAIIRDNTQRRKAEIEIQKTKEYLENIFKTSVDGVIIADDEGKIVAVNKAVEKMFNCSSDQLVGKHTMELEYDRKKDNISGRELLNKLFREGTISGVERTMKKPDGSSIVVEMNIALLKNNEESMRGSVASIRDITDRKQAEETIRKSEGKYRKLIEHAKDAIFSINRDGMIIDFNKKAEEMFGYAHEEIVGKHSSVLTTPQQRKADKRKLTKFKETLQLEIDKDIVEGKGLRKGGQEFPIEFSVYALELSGEYIATTIVRDITERKRAEKELIEYQNQLKSLA
jgi:PAS domain S-box-containing protein